MCQKADKLVSFCVFFLLTLELLCVVEEEPRSDSLFFVADGGSRFFFLKKKASPVFFFLRSFFLKYRSMNAEHLKRAIATAIRESRKADTARISHLLAENAVLLEAVAAFRRNPQVPPSLEKLVEEKVSEFAVQTRSVVESTIFALASSALLQHQHVVQGTTPYLRPDSSSNSSEPFLQSLSILFRGNSDELHSVLPLIHEVIREAFQNGRPELLVLLLNTEVSPGSNVQIPRPSTEALEALTVGVRGTRLEVSFGLGAATTIFRHTESILVAFQNAQHAEQCLPGPGLQSKVHLPAAARWKTYLLIAKLLRLEMEVLSQIIWEHDLHIGGRLSLILGQLIDTMTRIREILNTTALRPFPLLTTLMNSAVALVLARLDMVQRRTGGAPLRR